MTGWRAPETHEDIDPIRRSSLLDSLRIPVSRTVA
jgi:hypothetical protein